MDPAVGAGVEIALDGEGAGAVDARAEPAAEEPDRTGASIARELAAVDIHRREKVSSNGEPASDEGDGPVEVARALDL